MRTRRLALPVMICALSIGCGRQPVETTLSASKDAPAPSVVITKAPIKPRKTAVISEIPSGLDFGATSGTSFDVNSINPVKMDKNAASGSGFNPFAAGR